MISAVRRQANADITSHSRTPIPHITADPNSIDAAYSEMLHYAQESGLHKLLEFCEFFNDDELMAYASLRSLVEFAIDNAFENGFTLGRTVHKVTGD